MNNDVFWVYSLEKLNVKKKKKENKERAFPEFPSYMKN